MSANNNGMLTPERQKLTDHIDQTDFRKTPPGWRAVSVGLRGIYVLILIHVSLDCHYLVGFALLQTNQMYEWHDLKIFLAVAGHGSALAVAKCLGISQAAVNRRVKALEHALELTLFDRKNRGHVLTEQGSAIVTATEKRCRFCH